MNRLQIKAEALALHEETRAQALLLTDEDAMRKVASLKANPINPAEKLRLPLRALIEFMQRYRLPYKGGEGDRERGLTSLARIRPPVICT